MGRAGYVPRFLGAIHPRFQTPAPALLVNMIVGIFALLLGNTAQIITLSVFGALMLYITSMLSMIKLRQSEPLLHRPFSVPLYPFTPLIALVIALVSIIALSYYNWQIAIGYFLTLATAYGVYYLVKGR
jgi:ethanolamine permease